MVVVDHDEFARWMQAADDERAVADDLVSSGAFNAVVLHAEQAAQLALKGLLRGVGAGREAWGHALPELAARAREVAGLVVTDDLTNRVGLLARDYLPSRYPDALTSGTPRQSYSAADAERALATLGDLRVAVAAAWGRLAAEAADPSADEGP